MKAIKIKIREAEFLLPETHSDYEFPSYILNNKEAIIQYIAKSKEVLKNPLADHNFNDTLNMDEFKKKTGIIGWPFDMRDINLFALDRNIEITAEIEL